MKLKQAKANLKKLEKRNSKIESDDVMRDTMEELSEGLDSIERRFLQKIAESNTKFAKNAQILLTMRGIVCEWMT